MFLASLNIFYLFFNWTVESMNCHCWVLGLLNSLTQQQTSFWHAVMLPGVSLILSGYACGLPPCSHLKQKQVPPCLFPFSEGVIHLKGHLSNIWKTLFHIFFWLPMCLRWKNESIPFIMATNALELCLNILNDIW